MSTREIYKTNLPHRAVAVYLYLESRANKDRTCYPAIGTIARELHLSVSIGGVCGVHPLADAIRAADLRMYEDKKHCLKKDER